MIFISLKESVFHAVRACQEKNQEIFVSERKFGKKMETVMKILKNFPTIL